MNETLTGTDTSGKHIALHREVFGKGRARVVRYRFFREGTYCGYASTEWDARVNWERVKDGQSYVDGEWV